MSQPLVSIIIPFRNDGAYLSRAIDTALQQTCTHVELVLVNDGATDGSGAIADVYAAADSRVRVLHCEAHSIGRARNEGVRQAVGTFLTFLDSDDELQPDAIEKMLTVMEAGNADVVIGTFSMLHPDGKAAAPVRRHLLPPRMNGTQAYALLCQERIARVVWGKLYRSAIAKQVIFPEGILFEDGPFLAELFLRCAGPIEFTESGTVKHYCRPDSATRRLITARRVQDTYDAFLSEWNRVKGYSADQHLHTLLFAYYQRALLQNLVMLTMDHKHIPDAASVQECFDRCGTLFLQARAQSRVTIGPRTRYDSVLMRLYKLIGWKSFHSLFPVLRRSLFRKIQLIRSR